MTGKCLKGLPAFYTGKKLFVKTSLRFTSKSVVQLSLLFPQWF